MSLNTGNAQVVAIGKDSYTPHSESHIRAAGDGSSISVVGGITSYGVRPSPEETGNICQVLYDSYTGIKRSPTVSAKEDQEAIRKHSVGFMENRRRNWRESQVKQIYAALNSGCEHQGDYSVGFMENRRKDPLTTLKILYNIFKK